MKKKYRLKRKVKITGVIFITLICAAYLFAGGFNTLKTAFINAQKYLAGEEKLGEKNITPNKIGEQFDGTYKLSLTVTGDAVKNPSNVNIIVIVDRSGSMDEGSGTGAYVASNSNAATMYGFIDGEYRRLTRQSSGWGPGTTYSYWYNGEQYTGQRYIYDSTATRLEATQAAVNELANTLLGYNGKDGNPDDVVEMALVSFATTARTDRTPTTSASDFVSSVNSLNANGGTNWESALQEANEISFGANDNDPTYVIFFSDGSPTFHSTDGGYNNWNRDYGVYGSGGESEPNMERSYTQAVDDATALATKVGANNFYTIFAYGTTTGSTYMKNLTTAAGAPATNNYSASSTAELQEAFAAILEEIEMSGIGNVDIVDGTTNKVATSSGVAELLEIDKNSFQYWRTKDGVRTEWKKTDDPAPPDAEFVESTGEVKWDLSSLGVLENDVTYEVTFDVYPSQETYDLIADLKNDKIDYDTEVDPAIKKYLHKNGNSYSLATNTVDEDGNSTATITYTDTRIDDKEKTYTYTNPEPVATDASSISIQKTWENALDSREHLPVSVNLQRDGENFYPAELNSTNDWKADNIAIAVGLARLDGETLTVLDAGHDYKFAELGSESYNWELQTETVHPMLINGEIKKLILVEDESTIPSAMGDKTYYDGYYKIGNKYYKDEGTNPTIHAINHRRSNLNIKKVVNGENANPNDEFEFTITVTQKDEDGEEIADNTSTTDDDLWFSVYNNGYVDLGNRLVSSGWQKSVNEKGEIYYHAPNKTQLIVKLKNNENLRFVNVVSNTDFTVVEGNTANYELESITASGFSSAEGGKDGYSSTGNTITGNIGKNNKSYQVEYTNKNTHPEKIKVEATKTWDDKDNQDGKRPASVKFDLKVGDDVIDTIELDGTKDENGEADSWKAIFENLPKYKDGKEITYTVEEQKTDVLTGTDGPGTYEIITEGDYKAGYKITNKHTPELIKVEATKVWDDKDNQDGKRPTSVKFDLKVGDDVIDTIELDGTKDENGETDSWKATFTDLPKYEVGSVGSEIVYTVEEQKTDVLTGTDGPGTYEIITEGDHKTGYKITNKHTPELIKVEATKVWDDKDNQDGKRPTSVKFDLKVGDDVIDTIELDGTKDENGETDSWKATFTDLPKYEVGSVGSEIVYTVEEQKTDVLTGTDRPGTYEIITEGDYKTGYTITNKHTPELIDVSVIKVWNDAEDHDGFRPEELTVNLSNGDKVTLDEDNSWEATIPNLPKYANGQLITYTWTEGNLPEGYTLTNTSTSGYVTTLTNSYEPKYTEATVKKVWDDAEDQDGIRPDELEVTLSNGAKVTLKEGNNWTATIEDLPLYANGQEIKYSWAEGDLPEGYEMTDSSTEGTITTITNKHTPETIEVTAKKVWDDANDQDGFRPDSVKFDLKVGDDVINTIELDGTTDETGETAAWTATFKDIPKYEAGKVGVPIEYSVEEQTTDVLTGEDGPGTYDIITEGDQNKGYTITNKHTPELTEATVKKVWDDEGNQDGIRPDELEVTLSNGDKITLKEGNNWTATIKDLPKYADGNEIAYSWTEGDLPEGYEMTDSSTQGTVTTITNKHTPETIEVTAKKVWDDANDQDGFRPDSVKFDLKVGDDVINTIELDGTTDETGETAAWTATFTNLPKYEAGKVKVAIEYSVEEQTTDVLTGEDGPGTYDIITEGDQDKGYTITNKHTPELTEATVKKVWNDAEDQDGIRPEKLIVSLSNGTDHELNADNEWTVTVKNLDKYKDGQEITYSWTENQTGLPEGYELTNTKTEGTVTTLTNSYTPEVTSATIKKVWDDEKNQDGIRPDTLTVTLTANGKNPQAVVLNEGNQWEDTITGLPKKANGVDIKYEWTEGSLPEGYEMTDSSTEGTVTTITNKHTPETIEVTAKKVWDDKDDQDGKRPTSVKFDLKVGDDVIDTIELDGTKDETGETAAWTATFTNLPKYEAGKVKVAIEYSVEEQTTEVLTGEDGPGTYEIITEGDQDKGYTITNKHTPELTSSTVAKIWDDDNDRDGKRQTTLDVVLKDGDTVVAERTLTEDNKWTTTVSGLTKYRNGNEIKYTWSEGELKEGYHQTHTTLEGNNKTFTNSYAPETTFVCIKKVWNDDNDREQLRPGTLRVTLSDGKFVDLNEANGWEARIDGLYKYQNHGEEIKYTWVEENVDGYTLSGTSQDAELTTLTNTHDIETTEATVKKVWNDAGNQDGIRPDEITMILSADDPTFKEQEVTLKESNEWKATISKLPKYMNDGKESPEEVTYTWTEKEVPTGYTLLDPEVNGTTTTLTNKHEPELIEIPVKKVWVNNTSINFPNPTEVKFKLIDSSDGSVVDTTTLSQGNNWSDTFTELPKFRPGSVGDEIPYTVDEEDVPDYSKNIEGSIAAGFTITNTFDPTLIPIKVTKIWDDADDQDGLRHPSIKMTLVGTVNGQTVYTSKTETVSGSDEETEWTFTFNGLPKYYLGQEITYKVEETLPDNSPYTGSSVTDLQIMNSYEPQTVTMTVYKDWADADDNDRVRPETITVHLLKDGTEIDSRVMSDENGWSYTFGPLPKYRDHGTEIKYTVIEDPVDGYKADTTYENGDKEYNAYVVNVHELEVITLEVIKIWNDQNNKYNLRPNSITIEIYADGVKEITTTLTAEEGWKKKFLNMQKYKDGEEIVYTVKELPVANYTTSIDGLTITNTVIAPPEITPPNTYADGVVSNENTNIFALIMMIITSLTISCFVRVNE